MTYHDTALAFALKQSGYETDRDQLYVAMQHFYKFCGDDTGEFMTEVIKLARQVADDMSGKHPHHKNGADHCMNAHKGLRVDCGSSQSEHDERGHDLIAKNSQLGYAPLVVASEPTQSQIDARIKAKTQLARSLFDTPFQGQALGSHTYASLLAIESDGFLASTLIAEIGRPLSEHEKGKELKELLGGSEERIRKILIACGRMPKKLKAA